MVAGWLIVLIVIVIGASCIWKPTWIYEMAPGFYREEYLERFSTRFGGRFLGYCSIQFGLMISLPVIAERLFPGIDSVRVYRTQAGLFLIVFLAVWVSGVTLSLVSLIRPVRQRIRSLTDRLSILSEKRQIVLFCCATPVIPLVALIRGML